MNKLTKRLAVIGLASCFAVPVLAADPATPREGGVEVKVNEAGADVKVRGDQKAPTAQDAAATRKVREGKQMGAYRASDLLSMDVKNAEGKDLGHISDIVVSTNDGKVRYAAMSFGGFLGLGDKMFALPWDALRMKKTDDSVYLVLNVTKEKLESAPGFDQDSWPDFANAEMTGKLDAYYGTQGERRNQDRLNNRDPNNPNADRPNRTQRDGDRPLNRDANRNASDSVTPMGVYRVSQINSMSVYDSKNESIAAIEDVVIDIDQGKVRYVAVAFDDSWGYGEKFFAMPWKAFTFNTVDDETRLVLNVTQAQMKTATGFDDENWPNFADREWQTKTDKFYLDVPGAKVEVD